MQLIGRQHCSGESFNNKNFSDDQNSDSYSMNLGAELLTHTESKICSSMNLLPTKYLTIKTVLLSNPNITEIEPSEKIIKQHLISAGWIPRDAKL